MYYRWYHIVVETAREYHSIVTTEIVLEILSQKCHVVGH
jgi:hypothetical protein